MRTWSAPGESAELVQLVVDVVGIAEADADVVRRAAGLPERHHDGRRDAWRFLEHDEHVLGVEALRLRCGSLHFVRSDASNEPVRSPRVRVLDHADAQVRELREGNRFLKPGQSLPISFQMCSSSCFSFGATVTTVALLKQPRNQRTMQAPRNVLPVVVALSTPMTRRPAAIARNTAAIGSGVPSHL
jgi:hypothetical protein